jgi:hypothetical protein
VDFFEDPALTAKRLPERNDFGDVGDLDALEWHCLRWSLIGGFDMKDMSG